MEGQLKLLRIACSIKSHLRRVAVTRANLAAEWPFTTIPGSGTSGSLYVQSVTEGNGLMKNDEGVLLRGDQVGIRIFARYLFWSFTFIKELDVSPS